MSSRGMPWSAARSTICFATANRTSGSSLIPVSSLEIATTAAPYFATSGRTRSSRSSSPVTRVDERLALVDGEPGLERLDDRRVDRQRHVGERLDELDGLGQDRRLVGQRDAGVDVEHVRAGLDLGERVALDPAEVAGLHLLGQQLAAGRVDALADDDERPVEADDDLARRRVDRRSRVTRCSSSRLVGATRRSSTSSCRPPRAVRPPRRPRPRGRRRRSAARGAIPRGTSSVPISPARIAAASIASWKRGASWRAARARPSLAVTCAGMSRHQMTVSSGTGWLRDEALERRPRSP